MAQAITYGGSFSSFMTSVEVLSPFLALVSAVVSVTSFPYLLTTFRSIYNHIINYTISITHKNIMCQLFCIYFLANNIKSLSDFKLHVFNLIKIVTMWVHYSRESLPLGFWLLPSDIKSNYCKDIPCLLLVLHCSTTMP